MLRRLSSPAAWNLSVASLTIACALYLVSLTIADPDLWGHVLFGLDMLRTGTLPATDPYSYLSFGHPWINHELLSELAFGAAYRLGGTAALMLLKVSVALAIAGILYRHFLKAGLEPLRAGVLLMLVLAALTPSMGTIRPHLFTNLFFLLTLLVLDRVDRVGGATRLWLLPLLFALWINFHGGVLAGLGLLGLWAGARLVFTLRKGAALDHEVLRFVLIGVVAASILALLANPYGWRLPAFLLRTATVPRPDIAEWQPLHVLSGGGLAYLALIAVSAVTLARTRRSRLVPSVLIFACLAILPLTARRHLSLFALTFAVFLAEYLADVWGGAGAAAATASSPVPVAAARSHRGLVVAVVWLVAVFMGLGAMPRFGCIPIRPRLATALPVRAVGWLKDSRAGGQLAIHFNYGEYAIWHLADRFKVSMDGRRETVYPDSIYQQALRFQSGRDDWDAVLDEYPSDVALVPRDGPTYNLLELKPGWKVAYRDTMVAVFAREGWAGRVRLAAANAPARAANGEGTCFP